MYFAPDHYKQDRSRSPLLQSRTLYPNLQAPTPQAPSFPWDFKAPITAHTLDNPQLFRTFGEYAANRSPLGANRTKYQQKENVGSSPMQVQRSITKQKKYEQFWQRTSAAVNIEGVMLTKKPSGSSTTVIVYGMNRPQGILANNKAAQYEKLRKLIIADFLSIADKGSPLRRTLDDQDFFLTSKQDDINRQNPSKNGVNLESNDPKSNFIEVRYAKREDAESALKMNLKTYTQEDLTLLIGVRIKENPLETLDKQSTIQGNNVGIYGNIINNESHNTQLRREQRRLEEARENSRMLRMVDRVMGWLMTVQ